MNSQFQKFFFRRYFLCTVLQIQCKTGSHTHDLHSQLPYMGATASHNQHSAHCHNFTTIHVHMHILHTTISHVYPCTQVYKGTHYTRTTKQRLGADQICQIRCYSKLLASPLESQRGGGVWIPTYHNILDDIFYVSFVNSSTKSFNDANRQFSIHISISSIIQN